MESFWIESYLQTKSLTDPSERSSESAVAEESTEGLPTNQFLTPGTRATNPPGFAFVTAPPDNGSLSTNAEVVQSITTHLLMTLSRALSTQATTENASDANAPDLHMEQVLESVLKKENDTRLYSTQPTNNSFVQEVADVGAISRPPAVERQTGPQHRLFSNGNKVENTAETKTTEDTTASADQLTTVDVAPVVDSGVFTVDKVNTPEINIQG